MLRLTRRTGLRILALFATLLAGASSPGLADTGKSGPQGPEIRIQRWLIPMPKAQGRVLAATVARPPGDAPATLVVINHGSPPRASVRAYMVEPLYRFATEWFVRRGHVVVLPLRRGYGVTGGNGPEFLHRCRDADYVHSGRAAAQDIDATIDFMQRQPFVRPGSVIVVGISAGGWSTIGHTSLNRKDVRVAINFAGGRGGSANRENRTVCQPDRLVSAAREFGRTARVPTLWIYAENDSFFKPALAKAMHSAYVSAGGNAELHQLGPFGRDGHSLFGARDGPRIWGPIVSRFLARHGFK
ncbi:MAG: dienelactone hydrolase family protein [Hyphomicrobiaceae bacterium]